jgi:hypothetical protein
MVMTRVTTRVAVVVASLLWTGAAWAQGAYVGGAVAAEVVRTSSSKSGGTTYDAGNGEAFGGAIRIGTFLTERFGVELEYFRPGEIESDAGGPIYLADFPDTSYSFGASGATASGLYDVIPSFLAQTMHVRTSTTSALLTVRQSLGGRVALVYLGGVGFSRVVREIEYGFPRLPIPLSALSPIQNYSTRTTQYAAGPVVGVEVRAGMTEHAHVVAGLRVHALGQSAVDGWMIRPSVGLAWTF